MPMQKDSGPTQRQKEILELLYHGCCITYQGGDRGPGYYVGGKPNVKWDGRKFITEKVVEALIFNDWIKKMKWKPTSLVLEVWEITNAGIKSIGKRVDMEGVESKEGVQ